MLLCLMGVVILYVVWVIFWSFVVFLVFRLIGGISKGNVSFFMVIVVDLGLFLVCS